MDGLREDLIESMPDLIVKLDISNCVDDCLTTMALGLESVTPVTERDFKYHLNGFEETLKEIATNNLHLVSCRHKLPACHNVTNNHRGLPNILPVAPTPGAEPILLS
jgi:hypothetical protein